MNRRTAAKRFLTGLLSVDLCKPTNAVEATTGSGLPVANELSIDVLCEAIAWYLHYGDERLRSGEYTVSKLGNELVIYGVPGEDIVGQMMTDRKELVIRIRSVTMDELKDELSRWQPMEAFPSGK